MPANNRVQRDAAGAALTWTRLFQAALCQHSSRSRTLPAARLTQSVGHHPNNRTPEERTGAVNHVFRQPNHPEPVRNGQSRIPPTRNQPNLSGADNCIFSQPQRSASRTVSVDNPSPVFANQRGRSVRPTIATRASPQYNRPRRAIGQPCCRWS